MTIEADHSTTGSSSLIPRVEELGPDAVEELGLLLSVSLTYDECSVELVRAKVFGDPAFDPRYTLGLREGGRLVAAAVGVVQERRGDEGTVRAGHVKVLATDPRARRRGHATQLLDELERRFAAHGITDAWI